MGQPVGSREASARTRQGSTGARASGKNGVKELPKQCRCTLESRRKAQVAGGRDGMGSARCLPKLSFASPNSLTIFLPAPLCPFQGSTSALIPALIFFRIPPLPVVPVIRWCWTNVLVQLCDGVACDGRGRAQQPWGSLPFYVFCS